MAEQLRDAVVIGAGPAGVFSAILLARAGKSVLLVDAKEFPRRKVCGGCLNGAAIAVLRQTNLETVLDESDGVPLTTFEWSCRRNQITLPMSNSVAIDRTRFDHALVSAAMQSGTEFRSGTTAQVLRTVSNNHREILLRSHGQSTVVPTKLVICADGLTQSSLRLLQNFSTDVAPASRIGLASTVRDESPMYPLGSLSMAVSADGYVGVTRIRNGLLNVAAAVDARRLSQSPSTTHFIRKLLMECVQPIPTGLHTADWLGTPALTRRSSRVATERLFVLGDAAGYVEPITGEGMSFALQSAALLAPLVTRAIDSWHDSFPMDWERQLKKKVFAKQWTCRLLSKLLRSPTLCGMAIAMCRGLPVIPQRIMSRLNAD